MLLFHVSIKRGVAQVSLVAILAPVITSLDIILRATFAALVLVVLRARFIIRGLLQLLLLRDPLLEGLHILGLPPRELLVSSRDVMDHIHGHHASGVVSGSHTRQSRHSLHRLLLLATHDKGYPLSRSAAAAPHTASTSQVLLLHELLVNSCLLHVKVWLAGGWSAELVGLLLAGDLLLRWDVAHWYFLF
jgi:hypothetical protein